MKQRVLLVEGAEVADLEWASSGRARTHGLLGRDGIEGAILLTPANSVHTFFMRFPIDVAFVRKDLTVLSTIQMRRNRISWIRVRAKHVLEAEWGKFAEWGIKPGARLEIKIKE